MSEDDVLGRALAESAALLEACRADEPMARGFARFVDLAVHALNRGGRLLACGNGGSLTDAMHFTEELVGRFRRDRAPLSALALADPATLTCIANDYGFAEVFARQVEAHGRPGDVLLCLSTSGASVNLARAASVARARGLATVGLLGRGGGKLVGEVDVPIVVPDAVTPDRIQEAHGVLLHAAVEAIELRLASA